MYHSPQLPQPRYRYEILQFDEPARPTQGPQERYPLLTNHRGCYVPDQPTEDLFDYHIPNASTTFPYNIIFWSPVPPWVELRSQHSLHSVHLTIGGAYGCSIALSPRKSAHDRLFLFLYAGTWPFSCPPGI